MCQACNDLLIEINAYIEKADNKLVKKLKDAGFLIPKKTIKVASELEDEMTEILKSETKFLAKQLNKAVDIKSFFADIWNDVKDIDDVDVKLSQAFIQTFEKVMPAMMEAYITKSDEKLKLVKVTDKTSYQVAENSKEVSEKMKLSSHKNLEKILNKGIEEGESIQDVTKEILNGGIRDERYRARTVALTEMLRVHSYVANEAMMQCAVVEQKEWIHTGSTKNQPRENHVAMNGVTVNKNEPFELIGADGNTYLPMFPRDFCLPASECVNCHCLHRAIVSESALGIAPEERRRMQSEYIENADRKWEKELDMINYQKAVDYRNGKGDVNE